MARIIEPSTANIQNEEGSAHHSSSPLTVIRLDGESDGASSLDLNQITFDTSSTLEQDGMDLIITAGNGQTLVIEDYFSAATQPDLVFAQNVTLSANMVRSFTTSGDQFAYNVADQNDESAIGIVSEIAGGATITRADGTTEALTKGSAIYQGDIIETDAKGSVHVTFIDESNFSIGGDARLAIDEFVYDPASQVGTTNISMLRGLFLYTSGLIGKNDPDSVTVDTPVGSIGIRGTVFSIEISGNGVDAVVSIIEGAVVVTNGIDEAVISSQFDAVRISSNSDAVEALGQLPPQQIQSIMSGIQSVNPAAFAAIESGLQQIIDNNAQGQDTQGQGDAQQNQAEEAAQQEQSNEQEAQEAEETPQNQAQQPTDQSDTENQDNEANAAEEQAEEQGEEQTDAEENQQNSVNTQEETTSSTQEEQASSEAGDATQSETASEANETPETQSGEQANPEQQQQQQQQGQQQQQQQDQQQQGQQQNAEPINQQSGGQQPAAEQPNSTPAQGQGQEPGQSQSSTQGQPQVSTNEAGSGEASGASAALSPVGGNTNPGNAGSSAFNTPSGQPINIGGSDVGTTDPFAADAPSEYSNGNSLDAPLDNQTSGGSSSQNEAGQSGGTGSKTTFNADSNQQNSNTQENDSEESDSTQQESQIPEDEPFTPPFENTPPQFTMLTSGTVDENTAAEEVLKVNGVLQDSGGDPSIPLDTNDNEYPLSVQITANDSAASASIGPITFNIAVKENVLVLDQLGGNDGFIIVNDALNIDATGAKFGSSITSGDFNNDGALDLLVGAENAQNANEDHSGAAFMFEGNDFDMRDLDHSGTFDTQDSTLAVSDLTTGSPSQVPGYAQFSDGSNDRFGANITNLGDINGDGFDDAIVTASGDGRARVLLGGNGGAPSASFDIVNIPILSSSTGIVTVEYIGDINRDGFNDIIFGAPSANANATANAGSFTVLFGASTQSGASNAITNAISSGTLDAATALSPSDGFTFDRGPSTEVNAGLGTSIAGIGDFNGDGFDDFAVSEPARDQSGSDSGAVYIFAGNASGASFITTITPEANADFLGTTMTSIGDINGDGLDDLMIGAPLKDVSTNGVGKVYVVYGTTSALASSIAIGNLNTAANFDGFEIFFGSSANAGSDENLGISMSGIGDFNGDGVDDFIIAGDNGELQNEAYIIYGGDNLQSYLIGSVGSNLYLEDVVSSSDLGMILNYNNDFDGDNLANQQGITVEGLGDLNQDGFDDLAITTTKINGGQGEVYVIYGRDSGNNILSWTSTSEVSATAADQIYNGNHQDNLLYDNGNDGLIAKGNAGDDTFRVSNNNFKLIDGGNGGDHDVIHFDFQAPPANKDLDMRGKDIQNIEEFYIDNTLNTLRLDLDQVLNLLHQSDNKQLRITSSNTSTNIIEFFTDSTTRETLVSNGFTNDADSDSTQDNIIDGGNTYFQFTLIGSDYSVLIDSNIIGANAGGSIV